jgi:hypothetical protein
MHRIFTVAFVRTGKLLRNDQSVDFWRNEFISNVSLRFDISKAAFNKKRALFTSTLVLELRKKVVKCYFWSIALYGAETWTLRAVDQKQLEKF